MNPRVYLCGGIAGISYQEAAKGWRLTTYEWFRDHDIDAFSPMRGKLPLDQSREALLKPLDANDPIGGDLGGLSTDIGITTRDRLDVKRADLMFCYFLDAPAVSIGSMIELGWASAYDVPIVAVLPRNNGVYSHPIVRALVQFKALTLMEGLYTARSILKK